MHVNIICFDVSMCQLCGRPHIFANQDWSRDYCGQGVEEGCRGCKKSRRSYHSLKIGSGTGHL